MASERERAKEEYLQTREAALKADRKYRLSKVWTDTHYLLCGGVIIAAIIILVVNWTAMSSTWHVWGIILGIVAAAIFILLGAIPTRQMLKNKKDLHDLQQKMADLEDRYHL